RAAAPPDARPGRRSDGGAVRSERNERTERSPGRFAGGAIGPERRSEVRSESNDPQGRMKLGVVTTSYPRFAGDPAGSFVAGHVAALRALGHDVEVIAAGPRGDAPHDPRGDAHGDR